MEAPGQLPSLPCPKSGAGQVVCIEEFLHGILQQRLLAGEVQYCYEQQRAQNATLPLSNLDLKLL